MSQEIMAVVTAAPPTASLAPGFRFHPTDEELVRYYLKRKACGKPFRFPAVAEIDVYKSEPWELQAFSAMKTRDLEWYFFSPVDKKYENGSRLNRATGQGYWKATGKDRSVLHKCQTIGMKKTLVFHSGRAPDGKRTNWVMHEYRLVDKELEKSGVVQDAFVLCRIFQKSGLGPPNGDRYAPFIEEEWNDDATLIVPGAEVDDEMPNVDETRIERNDLDLDNNPNKKGPCEIQTESHCLPFVCKRERSQDREPIALIENKRSMNDCVRSSHANGSEDSTTTSRDPAATAIVAKTNYSSALLEFPLLDTIDNKENNSANPVPTFDSSNLEKSVPPGYLKFISNLEDTIISVSVERESLKIEVMRAQAMINVLQSRIDLLNKENEELRRVVRGA